MRSGRYSTSDRHGRVCQETGTSGQTLTFRWKDYRLKGPTRHKTMTLEADEFMRRFLLHVLPAGFHRIRHYGMLANGARKSSLELARRLLQPAAQTVSVVPNDVHEPNVPAPTFVCRHCGAAMAIIETLVRAHAIRAPPPDRATP